jgi:Lrp/AsnC family transcriptional regulator of ectoine degradation
MDETQVVSHARPRNGGTAVAPPVSWTTTTNVVLDETDIRILAHLQRDGRISKTALADLVGLSPSACLERMRRLEKKKLILSYHANVNLKVLLGLHTFYATITLRTHRQNDFSLFEQYVQRISEIVECHALGGGIDYLLRVVCRDVERYQALVDRMLDAQVGVDRYFTYIVTKPVKAAHQLPLETLLAEAGRTEP